MVRSTAFEVPTDVLIAEIENTQAQLESPERAADVASLSTVGLETTSFKAALAAVLVTLKAAEVEQERAKAEYLREAKEDQELARKGELWVKRLQGRGRVYIAAQGDDPDDLAGQLRFGKLKSGSIRNITYELRILIPEAREHLAKLAPYGGDEAFVAEGEGILAALGVEVRETAEAEARRKALSKRVRKSELEATHLLGQLRAADEAAALERESGLPAFPLTVIETEFARREAARLKKGGAPVPQEDAA